MVLSRAPRLIVYVRVYGVMRGAAIQSLHVSDGSMVPANSPLKRVKHKLEQELLAISRSARSVLLGAWPLKWVHQAVRSAQLDSGNGKPECLGKMGDDWTRPVRKH